LLLEEEVPLISTVYSILTLPGMEITRISTSTLGTKLQHFNTTWVLKALENKHSHKQTNTAEQSKYSQQSTDLGKKHEQHWAEGGRTTLEKKHEQQWG